MGEGQLILWFRSLMEVEEAAEEWRSLWDGRLFRAAWLGLEALANREKAPDKAERGVYCGKSDLTVNPG